MMKVLLPHSSKMIEYSLKELQEKMQMQWLNSLKFFSYTIASKVVHQSKKAMRKKELNVRERWLGVRFQQEISQDFLPNVSIRWLDEKIGYGVFAEEDFSPGAYMGEYTGIVRKRKGRADRKNDYCFEYTIGDWVYNPFIIDAKSQGNFTRFINHSEEANLESISVYAHHVMHICFIVSKPIKRGMQLSYDYGDTFWKKRHHAAKRLVNLNKFHFEDEH